MYSIPHKKPLGLMISVKFLMVSMVIKIDPLLFLKSFICLFLILWLILNHFSSYMANGNVGIEERMHLVWDTMVVSFCDSFLNHSNTLCLFKLLSSYWLSTKIWALPGIWPNFYHWLCTGHKYWMVCFDCYSLLV